MHEPESALSPRHQVDLLRFLASLQSAGDRQMIMATLLQVTRHDFAEVALRDTPHFRLCSDFAANPDGFVAEALAPQG